MRSSTLAVLTTSFPRFPTDEASLFLGRLIDALSEEGASGVVIVPFDKKEQETEQRGHFTIYRRRYGIFRRGQLAFGQGILPNLRKNPLLALQIPTMLFQLFWGAYKKRNQWELIHGHWIATVLPAFALHLLTKKPYIITVRGEDIKLLRTPLRFVLLPLLERAALLTTVSDEFVREIVEIAPALQQKISAVPNGITRFTVSPTQEAELKVQLHIPTDAIVLTYVGRVIPLKQPDVLLRILRELPKETQCHLVIAGRITESYREELFRQAEEHGIQDRIRLPGALSPETIGTLYGISKLYLSASTHEGRSNAVLEALASGVPPCVSDIPGHRELIKHNNNGIIFDFTSINAVAEQIQELLSNDSTWHTLSENARASVAALSWQECAKGYIKLFSQSLGTQKYSTNHNKS